MICLKKFFWAQKIWGALPSNASQWLCSWWSYLALFDERFGIFPHLAQATRPKSAETESAKRRTSVSNRGAVFKTFTSTKA